VVRIRGARAPVGELAEVGAQPFEEVLAVAVGREAASLALFLKLREAHLLEC
jgi:hypothetical protein